MNMMSNREVIRGSFGNCLEKLLVGANIKNATIAAALNYDVSYISKWITGKALPSRKNLERVLSVVSGLLSDSADSEMIRRFGANNREELKEEIFRSLRDAYYEDSGMLFQEQYVNNAFFRVEPRGQSALLEDYVTTMDPYLPRNIAVLADLFSLDQVSKLRLAGIDAGHFRMQHKRNDLIIDYVIDLNKLNGESAYDVILLIHMMTNFSLSDFHIYHSDLAGGKLLIAVRDECAGVTLLSRDHQCLCNTTIREKTGAEDIYRAIQGLIDPDCLLFRTKDMISLLRDREYFYNLFSPCSRWLVGHVTEHFLPEALFYRLAQEFFGSETALFQEAELAFLLNSDSIKKSKVQIILYNLALMDFMLTGELDFFNHKVILNHEDRQKVLLHIKAILKLLGPSAVKMVREGFSDDFKYITNPCIFLSDGVSYLRLENKLYQDNLLLIKDERLKDIFETFFSKIWNDYQTVMITDFDQIIKKLDDLAETVSLL